MDINKVLGVGILAALAAIAVLGFELANTKAKLAETYLKLLAKPKVVEVVKYLEPDCPDCKNDCDNLYLGVDEKYLFVYNLAGEPVAFWERCWSDTTLKE